MIARRPLALGALALLAAGGRGPDLRRGVSIAHWFRYPARWGGAAIAAYVPDVALAGLRAAGFTFVRIPVQPELLGQAFVAGDVADAARRVRAAGLSALVALHPVTLNAEVSGDQAALRDAWDGLAAGLGDVPGLAVEPLNEPVFAPSGTGWPAVRGALSATIRARLPDVTLVQAGALFSGVDGMMRTPPAPGPGVVAGVHFYEPAELTSLAAYAPGVDHAALAALPFPVTRPCDWSSLDPATKAVADFYCALRWDAARIGARLDAVRAAARGPVLVGEFGATSLLPPATRRAWLGAVRRAAEARGFGWCLWALDDQMGFGVAPGGALDGDVLNALGL